MKRDKIDELLQRMEAKSEKKAGQLETFRKNIPESRPRKPANPEDEEYVPVGLGGLMAASEKLLAINKGVDKPDERDSLVFKRFMTPDKLLAERVALDNNKLRQRMVPALAKQRSLQPLHPFAFDDYMEGFLLGNPMTSPLEEINPLHLVEQARRGTMMGPGGVGSDNAITEDMQSVRAEQFGFIDPLSGPESEKIGIDFRLAWGARLGSDGKPYQIFYDRNAGKHRWLSPEDLDGKVIKLPE